MAEQFSTWLPMFASVVLTGIGLLMARVMGKSNEGQQQVLDSQAQLLGFLKEVIRGNSGDKGATNGNHAVTHLLLEQQAESFRIFQDHFKEQVDRLVYQERKTRIELLAALMEIRDTKSNPQGAAPHPTQEV